MVSEIDGGEVELGAHDKDWHILAEPRLLNVVFEELDGIPKRHTVALPENVDYTPLIVNGDGPAVMTSDPDQGCIIAIGKNNRILSGEFDASHAQIDWGKFSHHELGPSY